MRAMGDSSCVMRRLPGDGCTNTVRSPESRTGNAHTKGAAPCGKPPLAVWTRWDPRLDLLLVEQVLHLAAHLVRGQAADRQGGAAAQHVVHRLGPLVVPGVDDLRP